MGYTTDFEGKLTLATPLDEAIIQAINDFNEQRHDDYAKLIGPKCNSFYCKWRTDGNSIFYDEGEKFYDYVERLQYLLDTYITCEVFGSILYQGEEIGDHGCIIVKHGKVKVVTHKINYADIVISEMSNDYYNRDYEQILSISGASTEALIEYCIDTYHNKEKLITIDGDNVVVALLSNN